MSDADTRRVDTVDEIEISTHHTVTTDRRTHHWEYEVHAGHADVLEVPKPLAEMVKTVMGADLESDEIRCAAEIRVIDS